MGSDGIFLTLGGDLVVLSEESYVSEDVLQQALAQHPEVIAGPTTTGSEKSPLLLVRREMGVPGSAGGGAVWSLDHLFLNADGVPVIVEVKRSSDTRIRREVVGQMLDYAANGVRYWPVSMLRTAVDEAGAAAGRNGDDLVTDLRPGLDIEEFWKAVEANLSAGRIRMVFVADSLPAELIRIIEFLNEQMNPAEVLGVELRQYVGGGHRAYVPNVIGRTSVAVGTKTAGGGRQWTEEALLEAARARRSSAEVDLIERLIADACERGVRMVWGKGVTPAVSAWYSVGGQPTAVWYLNVNDESASQAYMSFNFGYMAPRLPVETLEQSAKALESIPSLARKIAEVRQNAWNKYPTIMLPDLVVSTDHIDGLFQAINVVVDDRQRALTDAPA